MRDITEMLDQITASRGKLPWNTRVEHKAAEEGGCGVTGFIANIPVRGRHIFEPSVQMHNRGNGKGGGIAAVGLDPRALGVSRDVLENHYLLQVALLSPDIESKVEKECIEPYLEVHKSGLIPTAGDYRDIKGLDVRPPDVMRYFVRVKPNALDRFITENQLQDMDPARVEDEFIFQNSARLNEKFYASLGEKQAFVLSHGRNLMILKIVGYAELVARYYLLDDFKAHGWIAHQRYPTKGRVWHPGGAHPFIGMDEALVHNGDFANYSAITEYLKQFNLKQQFLTDTEVSVQLFDLWNRNFGYPLEYIIEAMAPTSEYDFDRLPEAKQRIYRRIQQNHIACSPDGPWFFIIARNDYYHQQLQLIGITDTAMLRPQVFAMQNGEVQIGLVCSEKQAIDATLKSLAAEDKRFCPIADRYWNARGGSSSDGGAFIFNLKNSGRKDGPAVLTCTNKFGEEIRTFSTGQPYAKPVHEPVVDIVMDVKNITVADLVARFASNLPNWNYATLISRCKELESQAARGDEEKTRVIELLTYLNDAHLPLGEKKRAWTLHLIRESLTRVLKATPAIKFHYDRLYTHIDWSTRQSIRAPEGREKILVIDAQKFPPEGEDCDSRLIVEANQLGWKSFIVYGCKGQRFTGCGLSRDSDGVRIDVFDSSGDYLASGIDGLEIHVHGNAQDQVGQIIKRGKLVIYGDVGQTFMYGAKGGEVYVLGNAAGRPLINAVGRPRLVINGSCLDYLAESFMAGDPYNGGGFVIMNGVTFDQNGQLMALDSPYPGSNLFSLASGGAIYLRDPHRQLSEEQLNGGEFADLSEKDWQLILPYLQENERLFGIKINDLLTVDGVLKSYSAVYRKVQVVKLAVLAAKSPTGQKAPKVEPQPSPRAYAGLIPEGVDADE
jgi:glutamate synthase domain-containing protein 1/glutamate synthase domain-containing protein 3